MKTINATLIQAGTDENNLTTITYKVTPEELQGFVLSFYRETLVATDAGELIEAARAIIERWETPLWKDATYTAGYINRLRRALDSENNKLTHEAGGENL